MPDQLDLFCAKIQEKINEQTKKEFGEEFFNFWSKPQFNRKLKVYTHFAQVKPSCGQILEFYILLKKNIIKDIGFYTDGCGSDLVCAEVASTLCFNQPRAKVLTLTPTDILNLIPKLPPSKHSALYPPLQCIHKALSSS